MHRSRSFQCSGWQSGLGVLIECVSFNDINLPLYFIFKGKLIQQAWLNPIKDSRAVLQVSDNGWTINAIGLHWLKAFNLHTRTQTQGTHWLLVLNGHESHVFSDFVQYCCDHSIVALCLPSHLTYLLQSLNVEVFEPLSKAYKKCVRLHSRYEAVNVNKIDFLHYYQARLTAITTQNVLSAWRGAGLISFNSSVVISKLPWLKTVTKGVKMLKFLLSTRVELCMMQKTENKVKVANKTARYHWLRGKVECEAGLKEVPINNSVFM
jgi:hypothetical protein